MKTIYQILAATVVMSGMAVETSAETDRLVITTTDGTNTGVSLTDIGKISFSADKMTVSTVGGTESEFLLTSVESVTFNLSTSMVENITANLGNDVNIATDGGVMTVTSSSDAPLQVAVYNINGVRISFANGQQTVTVDFNALPTGVYIVKANSKTIKFVR